MKILDKKYFPSKGTSCILPPGIYEIIINNKTLNFSRPDFVKVSITIDDIRLRSISNTNQSWY